jgi:Protein of unknown function (DUF742)
MTRPDRFEELPEGALLDGAAGPVVRPYAVTRGPDLSDNRDRFDLLTFIAAIPMADPGSVRLLPEHRALLARCREPISVAELASNLTLPLGVVRLLLGDLLNGGLISTHDSTGGASQPEGDLLKAVINGLRAL